MKNSDKKLQATIEIEMLKVRVDELNRARTYMHNQTYYNNRIRSLEDNIARWKKVLNEDEESAGNEFVIEFIMPATSSKQIRLTKPQIEEKLQQFLKREFIGVMTE